MAQVELCGQGEVGVVASLWLVCFSGIPIEVVCVDLLYVQALALNAWILWSMFMPCIFPVCLASYEGGCLFDFLNLSYVRDYLVKVS